MRRATLARSLPFDLEQSRLRVRPPNGGDGRAIPVLFNAVGPDYLESLGIAIRSGRAIARSDTASSQRIVVVNRAFADWYFPGTTSLGKTVGLEWARRCGSTRRPLNAISSRPATADNHSSESRQGTSSSLYNARRRRNTIQEETPVQRLLFATLLLAISVPLASAQSRAAEATSSVEWFVGSSGNHTYYEDSPIEAVPQTIASLFSDRAQGLGFETSLTKNINTFLGITGDFSMFFRPGPIADGVFHVQSKSFFLMAGPELRARRRSRVTPLTRALVGVAHSRAVFTSDLPGVQYSDSNARTGLAIAIGGGADVRVSSRCSIRGTFDYIKSVLGDADPEESGRQSHNRISVGLLVR